VGGLFPRLRPGRPDPRAQPRAEMARLFMAGLTFTRLEHLIVPAEPSTRAEVHEALDRLLANFLALIAPSRPLKEDADRARASTPSPAGTSPSPTDSCWLAGRGR